MPWQQDPQNGEWTMVDTPAPVIDTVTPITHATIDMLLGPKFVPAGPTDEGYDVGDEGDYPLDRGRPSRGTEVDAEGLDRTNDRFVGPGVADPRITVYENEDELARDRWLEEHVYGQGLTSDFKTGEIIDPDTGEVVGRLPTFYRVD